MDELGELAERLRGFAVERDWEQFHTPKNLVMALAGEVGELVAEFQWLTAEESGRVMDEPGAAGRVRGELADVFGYLVRLADVLGVDLAAAAHNKVDQNEARYDATRHRGSARKAPPLDSP